MAADVLPKSRRQNRVSSDTTAGKRARSHRATHPNIYSNESTPFPWLPAPHTCCQPFPRAEAPIMPRLGSTIINPKFSHPCAGTGARRLTSAQMGQESRVHLRPPAPLSPCSIVLASRRCPSRSHASRDGAAMRHHVTWCLAALHPHFLLHCPHNAATQGHARGPAGPQPAWRRP